MEGRFENISETVLQPELRIRLIDLAYACLCIRGCLSWLDINTSILTLVINILVFCSINYRRLTSEYYIIFLFIFLIPFNKGALGIIDFLLIALLLRFSTVERVAKIYLVILLSFVIIWAILYKTGQLNSQDVYSMQKGYFKTYGFENSNGLGMMGFHLAVCIYLTLRKYNEWASLLLAFVSIQFFYELSVSRTPWIGGILFCVCVVFNKFKLFNYKIRFLIAILPVVLMIADFYLVLHYDSFWVLDVLISGRLSLPGKIITTWSPINFITGFTWPEDLPLDGSFLMLLCTGGMYILILLCIWFYRMVMKNFKRIKPYMAVILGILACGVSENTFAECTGLSVIFWYFLVNNQKVDSKNNNQIVTSPTKHV